MVNTTSLPVVLIVCALLAPPAWAQTDKVLTQEDIDALKSNRNATVQQRQQLETDEKSGDVSAVLRDRATLKNDRQAVTQQRQQNQVNTQATVNSSAKVNTSGGASTDTSVDASPSSMGNNNMPPTGGTGVDEGGGIGVRLPPASGNIGATGTVTTPAPTPAPAPVTRKLF